MVEFNNRQRRFVYYFVGVSNGNATDAARRAGYCHPRVAATRLLANVAIRSAVEAKVTEVGLSADEILSRLAEQATGNIGEFIKVNKRNAVTFDFAKAKQKGKLGLIKKMKRGKGGWEVELYDAQAALALLGKFHNLFNDRASQQDEPKKFPDFIPVKDVARNDNGVNGNSNGIGHH